MTEFIKLDPIAIIIIHLNYSSKTINVVAHILSAPVVEAGCNIVEFAYTV